MKTTKMTVLTVRDIAERYRCTMQCARNYLRKMPHMEKPLAVYESDLEEWEKGRMMIPADTKSILRDKPLIVARKR